VIETVNNITGSTCSKRSGSRPEAQSISTLAGGIATTSATCCKASSAISPWPSDPDQKEKSLAMLNAERALHQSVNLTRQLLTFSKGGAPVKKPISLELVIESSVRFALSGSARFRLAIDRSLAGQRRRGPVGPGDPEHRAERGPGHAAGRW
jgi:hypothetical protein